MKLTKKENYISMCKTLYQTFRELNNILNKVICYNQVEFLPKMPGWLYVKQSINVIHYTNRLGNKNHMIISVNAEKTFGKFISEN